MKNMKKIIALLAVIVMLTTLLCVNCAALDESNAVSTVVDKVKDITDGIKGQFDRVDSLVKGLYEGYEKYVLFGYGVLLVLLCFFGYSVYKIMLFVAGAYVGFAGGLFAYDKLSAAVESVPGGDVIKWVIAGLCAILCAMLFSLLLKKAGLILFVTGFAFVKLAPYCKSLIVLIVLTCAVLLVATFLFKYFFIAVTSFYCGKRGAELIMTSFLLEKVDFTKFISGTPQPLYVYVGYLLIVLGAALQIRMALRKRY